MRSASNIRLLVRGVGLVATALPASLIAAPVPPEERTIHSQPSWVLATDGVEVAITKRGGHMAPVTFDRKAATPIRPYHVSPWQDENLTDLPAAVLVPLRGDFFCMPFGGNSAARGDEKHEPHGETATAEWRLDSRTRDADGTERIVLVLDTKVRAGHVTKEIFLVPGEPVVYSRHVIEGFAGPTPLAHHATLAMPEEDGVVRVSTSPFRIGVTCPGVFSDPANREYQSLASGATFTDLAHVPSRFKEPGEVDCLRFPARRGYADLLTVVADESKLAGGPGWTAAVNTKDHWAWFAIRDAKVLPSTVFWIENRGRHGVPWSGRNNCLGLEDVCAFFAEGLVPSVEPNSLSRQGIRTAIELDAARPTEIRYAQGAVRVPAGFDRVKTIDFSAAGRIRLVAESGDEVTVPVRHAFVMGADARPRTAAAPGKSRGTIGVSLLALDNPFFKVIGDTIAAEGKKQGYDTILVSADKDVARQGNQIKDFLVKKAAAIVLSPCDSKSIVPVIREANAAGIPVFTVDIPCNEPGVTIATQVATDNEGGGREAGRAMIEMLGAAGGKIAVLHFTQAESCLLRVKGFREVIDAHNAAGGAKIEIVTELESGGAKDGGYKAMEDALQAFPELRGVFAINDPAALGARAALEKAGKTQQVGIIGFDGQPEGKQAIRDGKIFADPIQFPDKMGASIVDAIVRYSLGETLPPKTLIPTSLYRKADAEADPELANEGGPR